MGVPQDVASSKPPLTNHAVTQTFFNCVGMFELLFKKVCVCQHVEKLDCKWALHSSMFEADHSLSIIKHQI